MSNLCFGNYILSLVIGFLTRSLCHAGYSNDICSLALAAAEDHPIAFAVFCRFAITQWLILGFTCQQVAQHFLRHLL